MKILGVSKSTGGLATYTEQLATGLAAAGIDVDVVCLSEGRETFAQRLQRAGLRTYEIDMPRYRIRPWADVRTAWTLLRLVRAGAYDVVIGIGSKAGFLVRLCGRLAGVPSIYKLASLSFEARTQGMRAPVYRLLERVGSRLGGTIVTVCHSGRAAVIGAAVAPPERVCVIHTGVDPDAWKQLPERAAARAALGLDPVRFTVGWAARMDEQKDPHRFLDAIRLLAKGDATVQACMAGDGALLSNVERRIASENLPILLLPWQGDMRRFLAAIDVFVLTSRWEGLPMTLLEAMASGRPVVATPVDGTCELVRDGIDGMLANTAEEIAACVSQLMHDAAMREKLGAAGRERVAAQFTTQAMLKEWLDTLNQVSGGSSEHRQ